MLELLRQRRSIRKFKPLVLEAEKVAQLQEALLRAPNSRNLQPCEFILVDDAKILAALATAKPHGAGFIASAALAVVIGANPEVSDVWIEDSSIAAIIVQLAAEHLGLKSCWVQLRLRAHDEKSSASEFARKLVNLPAGMEVPIVIGIGYPAEDLPGHDCELLLEEKVHHNQFSSNQ